MFNRFVILIAFLALLAPVGIAQLNATQQQPSTSQTQPSPTQVQACLAALAPAPQPPRPAVNLFPGFQQKIDDMIRKAGGDPVAMRKASADAAAQKYADAKAEYDRQRVACSLPSALPLYPVAPPALPAAVAQPQQPK